MNLNQKAALLSVAFSLSTLIICNPTIARAAQDKLPAEKLIGHVESEGPAIQLATTEGTTQNLDADSLRNFYEFFSETGRTEISVRKTWETGHSGIFINNSEVIRFRSSAGGFSPFNRAKVVANKLYQFLLEGGNPRDIKPGLENGQVVIRTGENILITVDEKSAQLANSSERMLALVWANRIRESMGVESIERGQIASRGFFGPISHRPAFNLGDYVSSGILRTGMASWYGPGFHGRRAANGSRFDMNALTAAHRTLPFGTLVKVSNQRTGQSCVVKITDRGPFHGNRIIDLSKGAARAIGMLGSGVGKVSLEVLKPMLH